MSTAVWPFTFLRPYREGFTHETTRLELNNGRELVRAELGTYGQFAIEGTIRLPYGGQTLAEWFAWWRARQGGYDSFLCKAHHAVHRTQTLEALGTGTGSLTTFALDMRHVDASTLLVYKAGVLQTLSTHYTVSGNNTAPLVTFLSAPSNGQAITATYDYYIPVRHTDDSILPRDRHLTGSDATAILDLTIRLRETEPGAHRA